MSNWSGEVIEIPGTLLMRGSLQLREYHGKWDVRDERGGPFGPSDVTREEAEQWLADPVRVLVVATLHDHGTDYSRWNDYGTHPCSCGAEQPSDTHFADMIAQRLHAAGLTHG